MFIASRATLTFLPKLHTDEETFGFLCRPRAALLKKSRRQLKGTVERKGKVPISLPITVRSLSCGSAKGSSGRERSPKDRSCHPH